MAACALPLLAAGAERAGRPRHVLRLDAHSAFHSLGRTRSGDLHGTPAAYATGPPEFDAFSDPPAVVAPGDVTMLCPRSVDPADRARLSKAGIDVADMRAVNESGAGPIASSFAARATAAGAHVHVSFGGDFLDPSLARAMGRPSRAARASARRT